MSILFVTSELKEVLELIPGLAAKVSLAGDKISSKLQVNTTFVCSTIYVRGCFKPLDYEFFIILF